MSQENVDWLHRVSEARAQGDTEALETLLQGGLAADFELQPLYPDRVYKSPEGMRELPSDALETWQDYLFETEEIVDLGRHVLVLARRRPFGQSRSSPRTTPLKRAAARLVNAAGPVPRQVVGDPPPRART